MDEVESKVNAEFKPLLEACEKIEVLSEEKLPILSEDINEKSINVFLGFLNELKERYERFLEKIRPIAGEIAGSSEVGKKSLEKFKETEELLNDIELGLEELKEVLKDEFNDQGESSVKGNINNIKKDYITIINERSEKVQEFFSQEIYSLMEKLKEKAESLESYYS